MARPKKLAQPRRRITGTPSAEQATTMACTLRVYARLSKTEYPEDDVAEMKVLVSDAIIGLMHFCATQKIDFEGLLVDATTAFLDQCEEDVAA